jgi:type IV pilus assembly protein PilC
MPSIDLSNYPKGSTSSKNEKQNSSLREFLNRDITIWGDGLSDKKKESFYAELSMLIVAGMDLKTALELVLAGQQKKDKPVFDEVNRRVLAGSTLSDALRTTGKFGDYEFHSILIGEETGRLGEVFSGLALYFKNKIQQRRKIISAVSYPVIVLSTSVGAVFFMMKFVVPMFADVFRRFGGKLPWITSVIISFSEILDRYFLGFILLIIVCAILLYRERKKLWFRKGGSALLLRLPLVGDIVRKIYLARFSNTMRLLVGTDTPLLRSISLVRQMIPFYPVEASLTQVEADVLKGESLHKSLAKFNFYPDKLIQLIKVGEEVNKLEHFFEAIAAQYTEEVEYRTQTVSSVLEPLIIIFLGLIVGVILVAMYLPMFQLSNSF